MTRLTLWLAVLLLLAAPAAARERNGTAAADSHTSYRQRSPGADGTFSSAERNLIRAWLQEDARREAAKHPTASGLPPGLQNKIERGKALPPGWQNKLTRGEPLSHEYYSRGRALPDDLLRRLPPPPPGSEILRIEDQVLRLDAATRIILDGFGVSGN